MCLVMPLRCVFIFTVFSCPPSLQLEKVKRKHTKALQVKALLHTRLQLASGGRSATASAAANAAREALQFGREHLAAVHAQLPGPEAAAGSQHDQAVQPVKAPEPGQAPASGGLSAGRTARTASRTGTPSPGSHCAFDEVMSDSEDGSDGDESEVKDDSDPDYDDEDDRESGNGSGSGNDDTEGADSDGGDEGSGDELPVRFTPIDQHDMT